MADMERDLENLKALVRTETVKGLPYRSLRRDGRISATALIAGLAVYLSDVAVWLEWTLYAIGGVFAGRVLIGRFSKAKRVSKAPIRGGQADRRE